MDMRLEKDSMGELEVPSKALYGGNTRRAQLNFPISNLRFVRSFIKSLGLIKLSAAETNLELGLIEKDIANAIISSAQEVIDGDHDESFVVDIFQTGSGTSTNMNANEVIANRAIEIMNGVLGSREPVHPNDHVNAGQSSNDVIPTAIHISALKGIHADLIPALEQLHKGLKEKSEEFMSVIKTGRTHLQDATPIWLGQEFEGHAGQIERGISRLRHAQKELSELAIGGTAVGTGLNTKKNFDKKIIKEISKITKLPFKSASNKFAALAAHDEIVNFSGE